jgi:hypothetical protein
MNLILKSTVRLMFLGLIAVVISACGDSDESKKPGVKQSASTAATKPVAATPAATATIDPATWSKMLAQVNPTTFSDPTVMCAQCHTEDDVTRYRASIMPLHQFMVDPSNLMKPEAYAQAMRPMMDPETYTQWYNAWMRMMGMMPPATSEKK